MSLSSLMWQIHNETERALWQMLVLCHDPHTAPNYHWGLVINTTLPSRVRETEWDCDTWRERERERGGPEEPEEMFCPIRLMLMRPTASAGWNTFQSHILLASFLFVHTVMLGLYWAAVMTEMGRVVEVEWVCEWWEQIWLFVLMAWIHAFVCVLCVCVVFMLWRVCLWCFLNPHLCVWMFLKNSAVVWCRAVLVLIIVGCGGLHSLLRLTSSKGSVYNLLPTTCITGGKMTSFQDRRQGAEKLPPSKFYRG